MELNENADLDTSQVEDLRGRRAGGGGLAGLGGGGGGGMGGLGALVVGLLPALLGGKGKGGKGILLLAGVALVACLCFGGGKLGGGLGNVSGAGGLGTGNDTADNKNINEQCAANNPNRFDNVACRNLLYVNSIQNYWQTMLPQAFGRPYQPATTRYFSGAVDTACGNASSGIGPFYCPGDNRVYIDLTFYDDLAKQFGANGQFAQPYVLAHEYGHHIQALLGTEQQMRRAQQRDPNNANQYSVMLELQADCLAGAWTRSATQTTTANGQPLFTSLSDQDIQEALQAAAAVGDDNIQKRSTGRVDEAGFTHGSSEQRQQWFYQGYRTGDPRQCNTFGNSLG